MLKIISIIDLALFGKWDEEKHNMVTMELREKNETEVWDCINYILIKIKKDHMNVVGQTKI